MSPSSLLLFVVHCSLLQVKTFKDYVELYLKGQDMESSETESRKVIHEAVNPRWEVCVTASDSGFQQASFVNSIATTKVTQCTAHVLVHVHAVMYMHSSPGTCTHCTWAYVISFLILKGVIFL